MSDFSAYLESRSENLKPIVIKLRQTITGVSSELKEEMKWNVPTYFIHKNICSIMAHKNHVNLQIFKGAKLDDAELLVGTGKQMRHIRYEKLEEVKVRLVKKIVKQAIAFDCETYSA